jgi:hypothetical protein
VAIFHDGDAVVALGDVIARYTPEGVLRWSRFIGVTIGKGACGVAVDRFDRSTIAGFTGRDLAGAPEPYAGNDDAFVEQYDGAGNFTWAHRYATGSDDSAKAVTLDPAGDAYIAGSTNAIAPRAFEGSSGGPDAFLAKFDVFGHFVWAHQFGGTGVVTGLGVARATNGHVAIVGATTKGLPRAPTAYAGGETDAYIAAF